jgi:hypothetical protein
MNHNRLSPRYSSANSAELTELELRVLLAVKHRRIATAQELRRELNWPSDGITLRAALLRLEEKTCISHSIEQGQFFYWDPLSFSITAIAGARQQSLSPSTSLKSTM